MKQARTKHKVAQHPFLQQGSLHPNIKKKNISYPAVTDEGHLVFTQNGRSALLLGMRYLGVDHGDQILIPAYHCPVMVYPVAKLNARPMFYRIQKDCTPDLDDIKSKVNNRTKAIIAVHYFGQPNKIHQLRKLTQEKGIALIEDCAHCFFGSVNGVPVGSIGDIAIASFWKFFPLVSGGLLRVNRESIDSLPSQPRLSLYKELKTLFNTLESSSYNGYKGIFCDNLVKTVHNVRNIIKNKFKPQLVDNMRQIHGSPYANHIIAYSYSATKMSFFLRFLLRYLEPHSIIAARRKNWDFLNEYIRGIQNIRPLFEDLSCEAIPYVLPIVAEKGDALSSKLRGAGINILRFGEYLWEEREKIGCPVSKKLSESCIQLPIHQSISEADLEYMATQLAT